MDLVAIVTGNLTAAATWGQTDATSNLVSTNTGSTALTTSDQDSAAFAPGAITVIGIALRLAARAAGSPTNTITITLRNSTGSLDVAAVTANVSDLPVAAAGANCEGGWHFFKFSAPQLLIAATNYIVRAKLSATTTAVSLCTNGTGANWQRLMVTSGTAAPAAGDDMHVCQTLDAVTNPATVTAVTVTMDQTAATDYGSASTNAYLAALDISKGGTLTWGVAAATAYILQLSGNLIVYRSGTYNQGTVATPIPRGSSATLQFDCAADNDFKIRVMDGGTFVAQGLSRTVGKNIVWTLLTANQAGAAVAATVADDTGWLNGDDIAIASTSRTYTEAETVTLSGDAGATSLAHGAVTNAHAGSTAEKCQAEVILLSRNVVIRAVSTTLQFGGMEIRATATVDCDWVLFRYMAGASQYGLDVNITTGSATFSYCCARDCEQGWLNIGGIVNAGTLTIEHCVGYNLNTTNSNFSYIYLPNGSQPLSTVTINDCVAIPRAGGAPPFRFYGMSSYVVLTNIRATSCPQQGIIFAGAVANMGGATIGPITTHSNANAGVQFSSAITNAVFDTIYSWRNGEHGLYFAAGTTHGNLNFAGTVVLFGNNSCGILFNDECMHVRFVDLRSYGDSTFAQARGLYFQRACGHIRVESADFSTASGIWVAHSTQDILIDSAAIVDLVINNALLAATTELTMTAAGGGTAVRLQRRDRVATQHVTKTVRGDLTYETTTVDVSPSLKMTPNCVSPLKLQSNAGFYGKGFRVKADSGQTATFNVKVRKDGTYAGNAPRLILCANPALGIAADVVGATLSVGINTWETLTYTTGAVTDNGVLEFLVDCDGVAGNVFVDTASAS
jgi:hypothetical protein